MDNFVNTFRIGSDPEFALMDGSRLINGENVGVYGDGGSAEVGTDHGGSVIEIRPKPAYLVSEFVGNIHKILEGTALKKAQKYTWRGGAYVGASGGGDDDYEYDGSCDCCCADCCSCGGGSDREDYQLGMGGHIHLELPYTGYHSCDRNMFEMRIKACDAVTKILEATNIHPKKECDERRKFTGYGQFGAHQVAYSGTGNGSFYRIEYRTPCSWLFDARTAFITLTAIKLAATSPTTALEMLKGESIEDKFKALVRFVRIFRLVDSDAARLSKSWLHRCSESTLNSLQADTSQDFKKSWQKHLS